MVAFVLFSLFKLEPPPLDLFFPEGDDELTIVMLGVCLYKLGLL